MPIPPSNDVSPSQDPRSLLWAYIPDPRCPSRSTPLDVRFISYEDERLPYLPSGISLYSIWLKHLAPLRYPRVKPVCLACFDLDSCFDRYIRRLFRHKGQIYREMIVDAWRLLTALLESMIEWSLEIDAIRSSQGEDRLYRPRRRGMVWSLLPKARVLVRWLSKWQLTTMAGIDNRVDCMDKCIYSSCDLRVLTLPCDTRPKATFYFSADCDVCMIQNTMRMDDLVDLAGNLQHQRESRLSSAKLTPLVRCPVPSIGTAPADTAACLT